MSLALFRTTTALVASLALVFPQPSFVSVAWSQEIDLMCLDESQPPCPSGQPEEGSTPVERAAFSAAEASRLAAETAETARLMAETAIASQAEALRLQQFAADAEAAGSAEAGQLRLDADTALAEAARLATEAEAARLIAANAAAEAEAETARRVAAAEAEAQAVAAAEAKAQALAAAEAEAARLAAEAAAAAEAEAHAVAAAEAEAQALADAEAEAARQAAEAAAEAEAQAIAAAEAEAQALAAAEAEARQAAEAAAVAEAEALAVAAAEAEAQAKAAAEAEAARQAAEAAAVAESEAQALAAAEAEAQALAVAEAEAARQVAEAAAAAEAEAKAIAIAESEAEAARQAGEATAVAEAEAQAVAAAEADAQALAAAEAEAARQAEEAAAEAEAEAQAVAAAEAEAQALAADEAEAARLEAEAAAVAEAEAQAVAEAEVEAQALAAAELEAARLAVEAATAQASASAETSVAINLGDPTVSEDLALPAAATLSATESQDVVEESLDARSVRTSSEEFATRIDGPSALVDEDSGLTNIEKALLLGLGAVVVGSVLRNGDRVVTNSGDRVVVEGVGGLTVYKDDDALLRQPGATMRTETFDDGSTRTLVNREDGARVVTLRDARGRVLRRVVVYPDGVEYELFNDLQPEPAVNVRQLEATRPEPRRLSADEGGLEALRAALREGSAFDAGRTFSLRQIREIEQVRTLVPSIELDTVTFPTGSAAIPPGEVRRLLKLGILIEELILENPREMFLIEGHTDAVGDDSENLALSDRRAESVALALTETFHILPENLIVQGYGEAFPRVRTETAEERNRRVTARRITPLLRQLAEN
ncbi:OmpA family protein [Tabrizicola sp. WMC-M-20]|nr:OmpA family protein [Tabrizicola sp. WMC-M-20]